MSTPPPATGVEANERVAASLYPEPPPRPVDRAPNVEVQTVRDADSMARKMYPDELQWGGKPGPGGKVVVGGNDRGKDVVRSFALALNPAGSAQSLDSQHTAISAVMTDIGASRADLEHWTSLVTKLGGKPPTADDRAAMQREAVRVLREQEGHGAGFDLAVKDAKTLATRDPRLKDLLEKTGLGDHPDVIKRLVELARAQRARGLIK